MAKTKKLFFACMVIGNTIAFIFLYLGMKMSLMLMVSFFVIECEIIILLIIFKVILRLFLKKIQSQNNLFQAEKHMIKKELGNFACKEEKT